MLYGACVCLTIQAIISAVDPGPRKGSVRFFDYVCMCFFAFGDTLFINKNKQCFIVNSSRGGVNSMCDKCCCSVSQLKHEGD